MTLERAKVGRLAVKRELGFGTTGVNSLGVFRLYRGAGVAAERACVERSDEPGICPVDIIDGLAVPGGLGSGPCVVIPAVEETGWGPGASPRNWLEPHAAEHAGRLDTACGSRLHLPKSRDDFIAGEWWKTGRNLPRASLRRHSDQSSWDRMHLCRRMEEVRRGTPAAQ